MWSFTVSKLAREKTVKLPYQAEWNVPMQSFLRPWLIMTISAALATHGGVVTSPEPRINDPSGMAQKVLCDGVRRSGNFKYNHRHLARLLMNPDVNERNICPLMASYSENSKSNSWDILLFTQHWPITVCSQWEEITINNKCTLPPKENLWTIHGIWPTKKGHEGPLNCNKSWHFDPKALEPILPDLELYWVNVEANTPLYSLWKHEWNKHGTCATSIPELDSELGFFRKGLEWIQEYSMGDVLNKGMVNPNSDKGYTLKDINDAIKSVLNQNPIIECVVDPHSKLSLIKEIRICFNKNLTLIDCDLVKDKFNLVDDKILTNCDLNKTVMYFDRIPSKYVGRHEKYDYEYLKKLYNVYNFIQHLIWVTL